MAAFAVLENRHQAFLGGQAPEEVQVQITGLHTVFAALMRIHQVLDQGAPLAFAEQFLQQLRDRAVLEDAPVRLQPGAGQLRFDHGAVAGTAVAGLALFEAADQAMYVTHGLLLLPDRQHGGLVEQVGKVGIVEFAHQFNLQAVQLANPFGQFE